VRCDPDASNHVEGDGEEVYGTKGSVTKRSTLLRVIPIFDHPRSRRTDVAKTYT